MSGEGGFEMAPSTELCPDVGIYPWAVREQQALPKQQQQQQHSSVSWGSSG